jgi:hypothetical protein
MLFSGLIFLAKKIDELMQREISDEGPSKSV